jgi:hypothetical protein
MPRLVLLTALAVVAASGTSPAQQVDWSEPWVEPQDTAAAFASPDEYAWRLFVALNWPADLAQRAADPDKALGDPGPVTWETWKNAREVFLSDGADPGPWLDEPVPVARVIEEADPAALQQIVRAEVLGQELPTFDPIAAQFSINETRLNQATYDFVRERELYHLGGQMALIRNGVRTISFPLAAKEIKAQWRQIDDTEEQKARYHWAEFTDAAGETAIYGLTALHITTKDLPNWFWATFEHVDNPTRPGNERWLLPSVDRFACADGPADCNEAPADIGLEQTKWQHYRLRGTQIDFTDSTGRPTLLANSQPEEGFQLTSSCITCHARATIGEIRGTPERLAIFDQIGQGFVGPTDPDWFEAETLQGRVPLFTQLDFVWSLFRARPQQ